MKLSLTALQKAMKWMKPLVNDGKHVSMGKEPLVKLMKGDKPKTVVCYYNNLRASVRIPIAGETLGKETFVLKFSDLLSMTKSEGKGDEVDIKLVGKDKVNAKVNGITYRIEHSTDNYIEETEKKAVSRFRIGKEEFTLCYNDVASALSNNSSNKYALGNILFESEGSSTVNLVATDGLRLHISPARTVLHGKKVSVTVNPAVCSAVYDIAEETAEADVKYLEIRVSKGDVKKGPEPRVYVDIDGVVFTSIVEGDYPDHKKVMPKTSLQAFIDDEKLGEFIEAAHKSKTKEKMVILTFGKTHVLAVNRADSTEKVITAKLPVRYKGNFKSFCIGVNPEFLRDALTDVAEACFNFTNDPEKDPLLITPDDAKDHRKFLVMPIMTGISSAPAPEKKGKKK